MPETAHHRGPATPPVGPPERSSRPFCPTVERAVRATADARSSAWSEGGDRLIAAPGSVPMTPAVNGPIVFEVRPETARLPPDGRFLRLVPNRLVERTWRTGAATRGAEQVVAVALTPGGAGTHPRLTHAGFARPDEGLAASG